MDRGYIRRTETAVGDRQGKARQGKARLVSSSPLDWSLYPTLGSEPHQLGSLDRQETW
jgi:hypothetical protein